jgi:hypothetical protein
LGLLGGIGIVIMTFVFGLAPGKPPVDVMLTIIAVVAASATLQASGGLEVLLLGAEKVLRRNPKYVSILAPFVTCLLTILCGTGHVVYTMLPIIYDIAIQPDGYPCQPGVGGNRVTGGVPGQGTGERPHHRLYPGAFHHHSVDLGRRVVDRHFQLVPRQGSGR